jgi:hypothetical protein
MELENLVFLLWGLGFVICSCWIQTSIMTMDKACRNFPPWISPQNGKKMSPLLFILWHIYSRWFAWIWTKVMYLFFFPSFNLYSLLFMFNVFCFMSFAITCNLCFLFFGFQKWQVKKVLVVYCRSSCHLLPVLFHVLKFFWLLLAI